jgi:hypothetical protein
MLYLQYNVHGHIDGGGAQIHRILAIYSLAKFRNLEFIKLPLVGVITPSYSPEIEHRQEVLRSWNSMLDYLPNSTKTPRSPQVFDDKWLDPDFFRLTEKISKSRKYIFFVPHYLLIKHFIPALKFLLKSRTSSSFQQLNRAKEKTKLFLRLVLNKDCVLNITEPFKVVTEGNQYIHSNLKLGEVVKLQRSVSIGVHVRRGDLNETDRTRYLPDAFYVEVLNFVLTFLNLKNIAYSIEYFVDLPKGGNFFVSENKKFSWNFIPLGMEYTVNIESDAGALRSLSAKDIIIGSKSSFSFVAGLLSSAVMIQPEWWINNPDDWETIKLSDSNLPLL